MSYASCSGGVYTGTFLPCDADGVYRFVVTGANGYSDNAAGCLYSGAGLTLAAAGTTTGVLTGNTLTGTVNNSVVVSENSSMNAWNSLQWTTTKDANDFGGTLSVYPGAGFAGYAQPASASYTVAGGSYSASPFGTAGGAINLYAGGLKLYGQSGGLPVNKGALNFQGTSYVGLNGGSVYVASLTFASVNRVNNGVLIVDFQTGSAGAGENFIDANYANDFPVNNGMVAPWAVTYYSNGSFLTYNAAKGLQPAAFTNTNNLPNAGPNDIVQLTSPSGTVLSQSQEIYALSIYGYPFSSNSSSNTLTIDSGGLIVWAGNDFNDNVNITFGNSTTCAEGVIYTNWSATFSGNLTANNGLTIAGSINGFGFNCTLTGNNTIMSNNGAAPGTLTIDGGAWVQINSASAIGGSATTVYINGGGGDSNIQLGAGTWAGLGISNNLSLSNPIVIGPAGGALDANGNNFTINGTISGSGALGLYGTGTINLNGTNSYTGGTTVKEASVYVASGSTLGTGPVLVYDGFDQAGTSELYLQGTANIASNAAVAIVQENSFGGGGIYVQCASATWGSLEGNGLVWLAGDTNGNGGSPCTLTIGGNGANTEFTGEITDNSYQNSGSVGSLVKNGGGTFNLIGQALLAGTVTVNGGTLTVTGTLGSAISTAGVATVNSGGTLNGSGVVGRNVVLAGENAGRHALRHRQCDLLLRHYSSRRERRCRYA